VGFAFLQAVLVSRIWGHIFYALNLMPLFMPPIGQDEGKHFWTTQDDISLYLLRHLRVFGFFWML
jgi:hypothetical protein